MTQRESRDMLRDLLQVRSGLTGWEAEFIEKMNAWEGAFTAGQAAKLEEIWDKRLGNIATTNG